MKSIYQKITLILIIGFVVQILLIGIFYKQFFLGNVIKEMNNQETYRQDILKKGLAVCAKLKDDDKLSIYLDKISKDYNVKFLFKDVNGEILYKNIADENTGGLIKEQGYLKVSGKIEYIVQCYFQPKLYTGGNRRDKIIRAALILSIVLLATFSLYLIYKTLANPIKNLSKAITTINYGNTLSQIPYEADDEFGLLCRNFEDMGRRLKASEEGQRQLLKAISHDIKTPLTSIMGYSKRLYEGKVLEEKKEQYYETIYRKSLDLKSLLEELDDYSSINVGNKYSLKNVDVLKFYNAICPELKMDSEEKGATLKFKELVNESNYKNLYISIDEKKMKRVLYNIVENSIKYAGENPIIEIKAVASGKKIEISIWDNGFGVPCDKLEIIFERFYRIDTSRSRDKGGTGLGLAICKEIIENFQGDIIASNLKEGGLMIKISLPLLS